MKLIVIVNHDTDTFETCIPSRDLSSEEIITINEMRGHGEHRTVHFAECGDRAIPFLDIVEVLQKLLNEDSDTSHPLQGVPTKIRK
jgi:hypothetical protein